MSLHLTNSLELYAERHGDPAERIYARLFARHPALKALFDMDTDGGVRGSMLQQAFDCLIDLTGEGRLAATIIGAEQQNHDAYGVAPEAFATFFEAIRDEVRAGLGLDWTAETDTEWSEVLQRASGLAAAA